MNEQKRLPVITKEMLDWPLEAGLETERNAGITPSGGEKSSDQVSVKLIVDYSHCTLRQVLGWATADRVIAAQRLRGKLSGEALRELAKTGMRFAAAKPGERPKTESELIEELIRAGLPRKLAVMRVREPERYFALMDQLGEE